MSANACEWYFRLFLGVRQSAGPLVPSFSLAVRLLLLIRTASAMYANIQDCDEGEARAGHCQSGC